MSLRRSKLAIKEFCFPVETPRRRTHKRGSRRDRTTSRDKSRLSVAYCFLLKHYKSAEAVYCLSAIISFFLMLVSCLPLSVVLVEMGAWALIVIFWLWLMDRGIFVHRWCGCSDNAVLAAILLLLITGIITQFLLFYVVSCLLK